MAQITHVAVYADHEPDAEIAVTHHPIGKHVERPYNQIRVDALSLTLNATQTRELRDKLTSLIAASEPAAPLLPFEPSGPGATPDE